MNSREKKKKQKRKQCSITPEPRCLHLSEKNKTSSVVQVKILFYLYCGIKKKHLY